MADTYTSNLKVRLPETGQYNNSWGTVLNSDAIELLDQAITGESEIALGSSTAYSLAALANGQASEARRFALYFSGTPAGTVTVTIPASVTRKFYLIENETGQDIVLGYATGTSVTISTGTKQLVWADQSVPAVYRVTADAVNALQLGGVAAAQYARLNLQQTFTKGQRYATVALLDGATITIDCDLGNNFSVTLGGSRALANPNNASDGQTIQIFVKQDGTGSRTLTYGAKFRWPAGIAPTLTPTANRVDMIVATYVGALDVWMSSIIQNYTVT